MEIKTIEFESHLVITLNEKKKIVMTLFKTQEHGHIKMGIEAPHDVQVNREEIYLKKKEQLKLKQDL